MMLRGADLGLLEKIELGKRCQMVASLVRIGLRGDLVTCL